MPKVFSILQYSSEYRNFKETIVRNTSKSYSGSEYEKQRKCQYLALARLDILNFILMTFIIEYLNKGFPIYWSFIFIYLMD